jgi:hypothetical protein
MMRCEDAGVEIEKSDLLAGQLLFNYSKLQLKRK